MQLLCDAVTILGSRHGVLLNPIAKECGIVRFDKFSELPRLHLRAGVAIGGREVLLPLCPEGGGFSFHDQRTTPCTVALTGIDAASCVKLKLTVATPWRPRDPEFSTTPVLALRLEASLVAGSFRWEKCAGKPEEVEVFVEFAGPDVKVRPSGADALELSFASTSRATGEPGFTRDKARAEKLFQLDRIVALDGELRGTRFVKRVVLDKGGRPPDGALELAWCAHSAPVLAVQRWRLPFRYADRFADLSAVAAWAREHGIEILANAERVDGIVAANNLSASTNRLLALTLHSWLANTWWARREDGREWFSVWEGNCYYHSTVDVEFTQAPFYLAVWPELLGIELDWWPEYSKGGEHTLGERGAGTLFLSHDAGSFSTANGQDYPHEMEVEETANYVILALAHWRRTGDRSVIEKHAATIGKFLDFLAACDSRGAGWPDQGVANTIDDGSPAIQFGRAQTYLAVKCLAAFLSGAEILMALGREDDAERFRKLAGRARAAVEERGWRGDHYAVLLDKSGRDVVDPWTGERMDLEELPGWDAAHIYTANSLAILDMVGLDAGLDPERVAADLRVGAERCLREYGCVHTDFDVTAPRQSEAMKGLAGASRNPGWISMNMLRDIAAFYRGVDLRALSDRYWDWQATAGSQEPRLFFETFAGNNLAFYPRGVAVWGFFDALAGRVVDKTAGVDRTAPPFEQVRVPGLLEAEWGTG